jgi:hypothetical protein
MAITAAPLAAGHRRLNGGEKALAAVAKHSTKNNGE